MRFICTTFGAIPEEAEIIMRISRVTVGAAGHEWVHMPQPAKASPQEAAIAKDLLVLHLATLPEYANAVFLDHDIELRAIWGMLAGMPYFIHEFPDCDRPEGRPHIGMFAVNGCTQWFRDLQAEKIRRGIQDVYGYPNKLLRDKKPGVIPESCYTHHRLTSGK